MLLADNWFDIRKINEKTYVISEYNHYEKTHCYLIIGDKKAILIDTGLGVSNIHSVIQKITNLPILVIITHVHWDHIGGLKHFNNFAVHEKDVNWIKNKFPLSIDMVKSQLLKYECEFPDDFNINNYSLFKGDPTIILKDNDIIDLGGRNLKIIHTPGHCPGHICIYEEKKGYLFTGDLIYKGKIDISYESTNPIDFMKSIEKISKLKINKIFPGHFDLEINQNIIFDILKVLEQIYSENKLKHGSGIFEFDNFKICM